ncbi:MAG: ATP cone domain-containing protein [Candidatus Paceibacterota bacterium]
MSVMITKADDTREPFKATKLRRSLKKAGATAEEVSDIVGRIEGLLYDGMYTEEIYRKAFEFLREGEGPSAARYSLRRALFGLGPTGFPFEDFLTRLFAAEGYQTKTRLIINGKCTAHELDVAAYKADDSFVVEAKFHARPGIKSDLQVALYCYARKLDLMDKPVCSADVCGIQDFMIVTNTKFTSAAEAYAECVGLKLLSWDYPKHHNLHDRIQESGLYPITVLQNLSNAQKRALIERGIIVCSDLLKKPHMLRHAHLSPRKVEAVLSEARQLGDR